MDYEDFLKLFMISIFKESIVQCISDVENESKHLIDKQKNGKNRQKSAKIDKKQPKIGRKSIRNSRKSIKNEQNWTKID